MSLPDERPSYKEPSSPVGRMQSGLAALFVTPDQNFLEETVTDSSRTTFMNKRKPSSMTVARVF